MRVGFLSKEGFGSMSYKIQFLPRGSNLWENAMSGLGSEQEAIFQAKFIAKRPQNARVRIIDRNGSVVWIS